MFNKGDKYIHFTKYGGVNKGEVEWYGSQINWDTENMVAYHIPYIKSTKGIVIHLNGEDGRLYKIKGDITEDMLNKLKSSSTIFEELKNRKEQRRKELENKIEKHYENDTDYLTSSKENIRRLDESIKELNKIEDEGNIS